MEDSLDCSLAVSFSGLDDPRINRTKKYPLIEVIFLTIVAALCGADSWRDVVLVGEAKMEWLRQFFPFVHSIPSHDTIGRVFSLLSPKGFHDCFLAWTKKRKKLSLNSKRKLAAMDNRFLEKLVRKLS